MNTKKKKIIIGSSVVLALILIGVGLYFFFRAKNSENQSFFGNIFKGDISTVPIGEDGIKTLPRPGIPQEGEAPRLQKISAEPVIGATFIPDSERVKYFKQSTGHLFENTYDGLAERRTSNITIPAIKQALWSPSKEFAVLSYYSDGSFRHFYTKYSGTTTAESGFLPPSLASITMSSARDQIAYTIPVEGDTAIITARPDNTGQSTVLRTSIPDIILSYPDATTISVQTKGSAYAESYLYALDVGSRSLSNVFPEKYGFSAIWSPDTEYILYLEGNEKGSNPFLYVYTRNNGTIRRITLTTLPEKCTWSLEQGEHILYCGVPHSLPHIGIPDIWWQGAVSFSDSIWQINLDTNEQIKLVDTTELDVDAVDLFTSENASHLFFTNKKDGNLWSYRLN